MPISGLRRQWFDRHSAPACSGQWPCCSVRGNNKFVAQGRDFVHGLVTLQLSLEIMRHAPGVKMVTVTLRNSQKGSPSSINSIATASANLIRPGVALPPDEHMMMLRHTRRATAV